MTMDAIPVIPRANIRLITVQLSRATTARVEAAVGIL